MLVKKVKQKIPSKEGKNTDAMPPPQGYCQKIE